MEPGRVSDVVRGLAAAGVKGLNVTTPHKLEAIDCLDELDESAKRIGAVNTISLSQTSAIGHNTDGVGFTRFLTEDAGFVIQGSTAVLLGAGGAARALIVALSDAGCASVTVAARDVSKAKGLAELAGDSRFSACELAEVDEVVRSSDLIVNAIPLMHGPENVSEDAISPGAVVVDLTYAPPITPLIAAARRRGAVAHSGLGMLLHQACLAFEIWTGVIPPIDVMSAAALGAIASHRP